MQINSSTFTPGCLVKIKNAIFFPPRQSFNLSQLSILAMGSYWSTEDPGGCAPLRNGANDWWSKEISKVSYHLRRRGVHTACTLPLDLPLVWLNDVPFASVPNMAKIFSKGVLPKLDFIQIFYISRILRFFPFSCNQFLSCCDILRNF